MDILFKTDMAKKIYFHVDGGSMPLELWDNIDDIDRANSYERTEELIRCGAENIHTMSMAHLSFDLIDLGYDIYLCYRTTEYQVYPGLALPPTGKELRKGHNIRKMFIAHSFDYVLGIKKVIGYYTYGDQNNAKNVKLAFERKGYTCPDFGTDSKNFFFYTLPNSKYVSHCDATLDDNKLLAQLFKTHQGYQELLIPTDEVPTDGVQTDGNDDTVIAPIYKAGDTLTGDGVYFTIDRVDYAQQKYFDDSIGGFIHFSDQEKWNIGVRPKFKVGDKLRRVNESWCGHYDVSAVDDKKLEYAISWWEDGCPCGTYVPFSEQDDYYLVIKPKFKVGDEVYNRVDKSLGHVVIESVDDTTYYGDTTNFDITDQDQWELVKKPLTVHEAIKHAKEVARTCDDPICAKDHKNLAYWLEELMEYRHRYGPFIETCDN